MLQGYKYEKNIEKYKQIELPKGMRCYIMEVAIPLLWRFRPATWLVESGWRQALLDLP